MSEEQMPERIYAITWKPDGLIEDDGLGRWSAGSLWQGETQYIRADTVPQLYDEQWKLIKSAVEYMQDSCMNKAEIYPGERFRHERQAHELEALLKAMEVSDDS